MPSTCQQEVSIKLSFVDMSDDVLIPEAKLRMDFEQEAVEVAEEKVERAIRIAFGGTWKWLGGKWPQRCLG